MGAGSILQHHHHTTTSRICAIAVFKVQRKFFKSCPPTSPSLKTDRTIPYLEDKFDTSYSFIYLCYINNNNTKIVEGERQHQRNIFTCFVDTLKHNLIFGKCSQLQKSVLEYTISRGHIKYEEPLDKMTSVTSLTRLVKMLASVA